MRLSTTALRALRATRVTNLTRPSLVDPRVRALCVSSSTGNTEDATNNSSPAAADKLETNAQETLPIDPVSASASLSKSDETTPALETKTDDFDPEITIAPAIDAASAIVSEADEPFAVNDSSDVNTDAMLQESLATDDDDIKSKSDGEEESKAMFMQPDYLKKFKDADGFFDYLKGTVRRNPIRAMLLTRNAIEEPGAPFLTEKVFQLMLPIMSRNNWFRTVRDTMKIVEEKGYEINTIRYNCVLFTMYRDSDPNTYQKMKEIVDKMHKSPRYSQPNATTYNLLIASLFYCGSVEEAFEVVNTMKSLGINPTAATYQTLVSGCLRRKEYDSAFDTIVLCEHNGMSLGALPYAQVLYLCSRLDKYPQMYKLITRLDDVVPIYRDYLERIQQRRNLYNPRDTIIGVSERGEPKIELSVFYSVLQSCARGGRPDLAILTWNLYKQNYPDRKPTRDMWISLICSLAMAGNHNAAIDGLAHMRADGYETRLQEFFSFVIRPIGHDISKIDDIYYYLIDCVEGNAKTDVLDNIVPQPEAIDDGTDPDETDAQPQTETETEVNRSIEAGVDAKENQEPASHVSLRDQIGLGDTGKHIMPYEVPWAGQSRPPVTISDFNIIISACAVAGDIDRAFQTYDEACGRLGMQRDQDTLFSLLEGCVQVGHIRGGMRVLDEARLDNCLLTPQMIHMASRLYCRSARTPKAYDLIREAEENNVPIHMRTLEMVARHLYRSGLHDESQEIVQIGIRQGYREQTIAPVIHNYNNRFEQGDNRRSRNKRYNRMDGEGELDTPDLLASDGMEEDAIDNKHIKMDN